MKDEIIGSKVKFNHDQPIVSPEGNRHVTWRWVFSEYYFADKNCRELVGSRGYVVSVGQTLSLNYAKCGKLLGEACMGSDLSRYELLIALLHCSEWGHEVNNIWSDYFDKEIMFDCMHYYLNQITKNIVYDLTWLLTSRRFRVANIS